VGIVRAAVPPFTLHINVCQAIADLPFQKGAGPLYLLLHKLGMQIEG
jgi:hypothetical protein